MNEYKVIILDASPDDATEVLNKLAVAGWRVVGMYYEDRVILERVKYECPQDMDSFDI